MKKWGSRRGTHVASKGVPAICRPVLSRVDRQHHLWCARVCVFFSFFFEVCVCFCNYCIMFRYYIVTTISSPPPSSTLLLLLYCQHRVQQCVHNITVITITSPPPSHHHHHHQHVTITITPTLDTHTPHHSQAQQR